MASASPSRLWRSLRWGESFRATSSGQSLAAPRLALSHGGGGKAFVQHWTCYDRRVDALDDAVRVIASLNDANVDYVVVGGVALNLHGLVRATEDLDIFVRPDPDNIDRLRDALRRVWNDPDIDQITADDLCGDYPAVRYGPPEGTLYLDILTRLGEATAFDDLEVEVKNAQGVPVRLATPRTLYRMKKDTVRPIDHSDANALRVAFELDED
jgi:hypothetical protein